LESLGGLGGEGLGPCRSREAVGEGVDIILAIFLIGIDGRAGIGDVEAMGPLLDGWSGDREFAGFTFGEGGATVAGEIEGVLFHVQFGGVMVAAAQGGEARHQRG
jgi:hypothetical protein